MSFVFGSRPDNSSALFSLPLQVVDLEKCSASIDEVRREAATMSLLNHPHVVSAHASFISGQHLWVVMPYLAGGSLLNIMKASYPDGLLEDAIAVVLRDTLKALDYLHGGGYVHRDIKCGNILLDSSGNVRVADFGVSRGDFGARSGAAGGARQTFVGTPCWMAPEVMEQVSGYDWHADIWSFGITALELAHGHAPFARYPPMKVLLMTIQNPPPSLDSASDKGRFSQGFREVVSLCLQKAPAKRPSAAELLKHRFFRGARDAVHLQRTLLDGLRPLGERVQAQRKMDLSKGRAALQEEERSSLEYKKGVSGWNFDLNQLKADAAAMDAAEAEAAATQQQQGQGKPRVESKGRFTIEEEEEEPVAPAATGKPRLESKGRFTIEEEDAPAAPAAAAASGTTLKRGLSNSTVQRGRFTVEEEDIAEDSNGIEVNEVLPQLQMLLLQSAEQQTALRSLISTILPQREAATEAGVGSSEAERELMQMVKDLQGKLAELAQDNKDLKARNAELEHKLNITGGEKSDDEDEDEDEDDD